MSGISELPSPKTSFSKEQLDDFIYGSALPFKYLGKEIQESLEEVPLRPPSPQVAAAKKAASLISVFPATPTPVDPAASRDLSKSPSLPILSKDEEGPDQSQKLREFAALYNSNWLPRCLSGSESDASQSPSTSPLLPEESFTNENTVVLKQLASAFKFHWENPEFSFVECCKSRCVYSTFKPYQKAFGYYLIQKKSSSTDVAIQRALSSHRYKKNHKIGKETFKGIVECYEEFLKRQSLKTDKTIPREIEARENP